MEDRDRLRAVAHLPEDAAGGRQGVEVPAELAVEREHRVPRRLEPPQHRERRVESALGMVLERGRSAERRHDGVARELLDRPAGRLDLGRHRVVEPVEQRPRPFGILLA